MRRNQRQAIGAAQRAAPRANLQLAQRAAAMVPNIESRAAARGAAETPRRHFQARKASRVLPSPNRTACGERQWRVVIAFSQRFGGLEQQSARLNTTLDRAADATPSPSPRPRVAVRRNAQRGRAEGRTDILVSRASEREMSCPQRLVLRICTRCTHRTLCSLCGLCTDHEPARTAQPPKGCAVCAVCSVRFRSCSGSQAAGRSGPLCVSPN